MKNHWPLIDPTPLDRVLFQGQYPHESISLCSCSLENLSGIPDRSVDIVVSNAVFEHLYDIKSAFSHLARITKSGGVGQHQVDFRDHRNYSRPLEHLLLGEEMFYGKFKARLGEFGNRYRPQEMKKFLELAGFEVREFRPDIFTEEEYLTEFLERLRQARKSRYCDYPGDDLRFISGRFYVVKKPT
jgi:ubiquinone/menaquinone biosynthesis C-methylase UbiE